MIHTQVIVLHVNNKIPQMYKTITNGIDSNSLPQRYHCDGFIKIVSCEQISSDRTL